MDFYATDFINDKLHWDELTPLIKRFVTNYMNSDMWYDGCICVFHILKLLYIFFLNCLSFFYYFLKYSRIYYSFKIIN